MTWRPRVAPSLAPTCMVAVLFPTRARALDAAWRLIAAAGELKQNGTVHDVSLFIATSRYGDPRPELFLSAAAYELAASINIRLRDTEVSVVDRLPSEFGLLLDTTRN